MAFARPSLQTIRDRVKNDITSRLTGNVPLLKYSLLGILADVFSGGMHILYGYLDWILKQMLPITATDKEQLDVFAQMYLSSGRLAPTFATGSVTFAGTNSTFIPSGSKVVSDAGLEYTTNSNATIASGVATVAMTAVSAGTASNLPAGAILTLSVPISGVTTVSVPTEITNGTDEETNEALLARILFRIQNPPAGGSKSDYVNWALASSSAIRRAWCFPNYTGLGTVGVIVIQTGASPAASGGQITTVQNYINALAPVGAVATVSTIAPKIIAFTIAVKPNTSDVTTAITAALTALFQNEASPAGNEPVGLGVPPGVMLMSHIREEISKAAGLVDFSITAMTKDGCSISTSADIVLTGVDYAVLGTITYTTLS